MRWRKRHCNLQPLKQQFVQVPCVFLTCPCPCTAAGWGHRVRWVAPTQLDRNRVKWMKDMSQRVKPVRNTNENVLAWHHVIPCYLPCTLNTISLPHLSLLIGISPSDLSDGGFNQINGSSTFEVMLCFVQYMMTNTWKGHCCPNRKFCFELHLSKSEISLQVLMSTVILKILILCWKDI